MMTGVSQRAEANTGVIQLVNDVRKYEAVMSGRWEEKDGEER
jgi:hypothetical protein